MISEKAKNFLFYLVDKYHSCGNYVFDNCDYIEIKDHEKYLIELCNAGLILYDECSIIGRVELTQAGIGYKF